MCCCTYLQDHQKIQQPLHDKHLTEWLGRAISITGQKWLVKEHVATHWAMRRLWFHKVVTYHYELLVPTLPPEYQQINFYRDCHTWSINHCVPAELIVAYLIGICAGYQKRDNEVTAALV